MILSVMPKNPSNSRRFLTEDERTRIVALYLSGKSSTDIAREVGRDSGHVRQVVREAGVARERFAAMRLAREQGKGRKEWANPFTEEQLATARSLYAEGQSSNDIATVVGHSGRTVREYLALEGRTRSLKEGVRHAVARGKIKTAGLTLNERFFDTWTPEMAWVLGLLYGDGHVMRREDIGQYGVSLAGTEEVCQKVAALVNPALTPRRAKGANCWILQWYSRVMVETLAQRGLTGGNKARIIRMPEIPSEMLGHFLRGLWDSDGHWAVRKRSVVATLTSASSGMIDDLHKIVGGRRGHCVVCLNGKVFDQYSLHLRAAETAQLIELVYGASTDALRCSRKHRTVIAVRRV